MGGEAADGVPGDSAGHEGTRTEAGGDRTAAAPGATAATASAESAEPGAAAAAATGASAVAGDEPAPWCPLGGGAAVLRLLLMRGTPAQLTRTLTVQPSNPLTL